MTYISARRLQCILIAQIKSRGIWVNQKISFGITGKKKRRRWTCKDRKVCNRHQLKFWGNQSKNRFREKVDETETICGNVGHRVQRGLNIFQDNGETRRRQSERNGAYWWITNSKGKIRTFLQIVVFVID